MKKLKGFLFILLVLSLILSCNNDSVTWGKIEVTLSNEVSRGIAPTDMSTDNYDVVILNATNETVASTNIKVSDTSVPLTFSVPAGTYTISVDAKNKDNEVIGRGESTATVTPNSTANCQITVREITGNGTLSVQIDSDTPNIPVLKIYKADLSLLDTVTTTGSDGIFVATKALPNGFYYFEILDDDEVIDSETIRIVADKTITYSIEYTVYGDSSITITNGITPTPTISFELSSNITPDDSVSITPTITGFTPNSYSWYLDGIKIAETKDLSFEASDYFLGEHRLTLVATDGNIIWSEEKYFSIIENPISSHYVAYASVEDYFFFDIEGGYLYFSDTFRRLFDVGPLSFDLIPASNGQFIVFTPFEDNLAVLFIPANKEDYATESKLYYECSLDDENGLILNDNYYYRVNLLVTEGPVAYEKNTAQYSDVYHTTARMTKYGTFQEKSLTNHTFDDDRVCTSCGFNQYDNDYLLSNNINNVGDSGILDVARYWAGITTLGDGAVIEDESNFYIKKVSGSNNKYALLFPSSIYDAYEEGGGVFGSVGAFDWYIKQYYGLDLAFSFESGLRSFVETLWSNGVIEASPSDYTDKKNRDTVYSDISLITEDISFEGFTSYNPNSIQTEDGTPIQDCNRIYFELNKYRDGTFILRYPQSLCDAYEKSQRFYTRSGDSIWLYLSTYYPDDPHSNDEETKALMIKLLESDFIEPNYLDYL